MNEDKRVARGRIFRVENLDRQFGANTHYNLVHVEDCRNDEFRGMRDENGAEFLAPKEYCLLFTDSEIEVAKRRAQRNQEDIIEKGFMTDLLDDIA